MISTDDFEFIDKSEFYDNCIINSDEPFVIFGYASLISTPYFKFDHRKTGCVKDLAMRFHQGSLSTGTESWPGRVATLISCPENLCFGDAFYVYEASAKEESWKYLVLRENNYCLMTVDFYPLTENRNDISKTSEKAVTFVALPGNPQYLGDCNIEWQAYQIWKAASKWPNTLYLNNLLTFYRRLPAHLNHDNYLETLATIIEKLSRKEISFSAEQLQHLPIRFPLTD